MYNIIVYAMKPMPNPTLTFWLRCDLPLVRSSYQLDSVHSGVAIPGPTRALARASTYLALASKTDKNHMIIY